MKTMNFRTASSKPEELKDKLTALQSDFEALLCADNGISRFREDMKFQGRAGRLIREVIADQFAMTDSSAMFVERRDGQIGDQVEFEKLINTLRVVKYAPQSHPLVFTPRKKVYTVSTAQYELAFGIPLYKIATRTHTVGEFTQMAAEALTRHNNELVLTALDLACGASAVDAKGRFLRTTQTGADVNVLKASLDGQLRRMGVYGTGLTIFGSRYAIDPIFDMGATTENLKNELNSRGQIGSYRGAKLVAIKDDYNEWAQAWTKINGVDWEKLVFIAAAEPGAVLLERDLSGFDWEDTDVEKGQFRSGMRMDHGVFVHKPHLYGVIELA